MSRDQAKATESLNALFKKVDTNGNGTLDYKELQRVFGEHADQFLQFCDNDQDKAITAEEWLGGILKDTADMPEQEFQDTWVSRMETCVVEADAATPEMAVSGKATWTQIETPGETPASRSSHGLSFNPADGFVYCWGGEHEARHAIDSAVWRFKGTEWATVATTGEEPEPRVAHCQAITGGALYIWGGRKGEGLGEGDMSDFHKLDLTTLEWSQITAERGPCPRSFQQMCATPGKVHVFGGCSDGNPPRLADLHTFDLEAGTWLKQPDNEIIRGRGGAGFEANSAGSSLFVIAGFAGEETNDVYKFDLESSVWSTVPSETLRKRSVFPLCTVGSKIVIFGGEVDPSAAGHSGAGDFANDTLMLDTETLEWSAVETAVCPPERGWARMSSTSDSTFVVFGGLAGNDEAPIRMNDTWQGTLEL